MQQVRLCCEGQKRPEHLETVGFYLTILLLSRVTWPTRGLMEIKAGYAHRRHSCIRNKQPDMDIRYRSMSALEPHRAATVFNSDKQEQEKVDMRFEHSIC